MALLALGVSFLVYAIVIYVLFRYEMVIKILSVILNSFLTLIMLALCIFLPSGLFTIIWFTEDINLSGKLVLIPPAISFASIVVIISFVLAVEDLWKKKLFSR